MEITSACDLMAGEPVEAASFHARGILGIQKNPTTCRITDSLECRCECVRIGSPWFRGLRLPIDGHKVVLAHCQAVPQRELVRKSCSFITFYFYVLSLAYPQALSSSI